MLQHTRTEYNEARTIFYESAIDHKLFTTKQECIEYEHAMGYDVFNEKKLIELASVEDNSCLRIRKINRLMQEMLPYCKSKESLTLKHLEILYRMDKTIYNHPEITSQLLKELVLSGDISNGFLLSNIISILQKEYCVHEQL